MSSRKASVLFVCLGNICRSPTGEGVLTKFAEDQGLAAQIHVDSAGTSGYHAGEPADRRMAAAAQKRGYNLTSRSRQFTRKDFERFDLIVAMDRSNYEDIIRLDPRGVYRDKVRLLTSFIPDETRKDVPDPYYGGARGFEEVLDMIERAAGPILEHVTAVSSGAGR